jgi:hypothetical protein
VVNGGGRKPDIGMERKDLRKADKKAGTIAATGNGNKKVRGFSDVAQKAGECRQRWQASIRGFGNDGRQRRRHDANRRISNRDASAR